MPIKREVETVTIPNAGTDSDTISVPQNKVLLGFRLPASMTGTSISFKMGLDAADTMVPIYTGGTLYSITTTSSRYYYVDPQVFRGCNYLQLVSGSAETGAKAISLVFGEV